MNQNHFDKSKNQFYYLVGGKKKKTLTNMEEWHLFEKGIILKIDIQTGKCDTCKEYITPPDVCAYEDNPSYIFKTATLKDDRLYVCTQTEILVYHLPDFEQENYITLPCFNDLHHVYPTVSGTLLVAVTGLDMAIEIDKEGNILQEWDVLGNPPWTRFSRDTDYRKIVTTKPHQSHPNYVFEIGEDYWVSRFKQKDAICLTNPSKKTIPIGIEKIHDGILYNDHVYFTTVNGHVAVYNYPQETMEYIYNLNDIYSLSCPLGWCRGLHVVDDHLVIVGFTQLRTTKFRENIKWVAYLAGFDAERYHLKALPSRIALFDLKVNRMLWEHTVQDYGIDALFSIHPA